MVARKRRARSPVAGGGRSGGARPATANGPGRRLRLPGPFADRLVLARRHDGGGGGGGVGLSGGAGWVGGGVGGAA